MKRIYVIYEEQGKTKKGVLDENSFKSLKNRLGNSIEEYPTEQLMEMAYAGKIGKFGANKKILLG